MKMKSSQMDRRSFIAGATALGLTAHGAVGAAVAPDDHRLYGMLLHLGVNMWGNQPCPRPVDEKGAYEPPKAFLEKYGDIYREKKRHDGVADYLRCDEKLWNDVTQRMADERMNFCMIDIGEGLSYPSHPELGVKGSWTADRLRAEVRRLRKMGLEPIPKLNFSTTHDAWLGQYERMVSTEPYYRVVKEVIADVCEIFETPRFFHIGFDEEDLLHQQNYRFVAIRQGDLWWHDFLYTVREVERHGVRAWAWSDKIWHGKDEFLKRMPRSVLQSNWYYLGDFNPDRKSELWAMVHAYDWLEEGGFDQVPCASSCGDWRMPAYNNPVLTLDYCREKAKIAPERMKGLMMAPWCINLPVFKPFIDGAFDLMPPARRKLEAWPMVG